MKPQDPVINDHLGDAYWRVGRKLEARYQIGIAKPNPKIYKAALRDLGLEANQAMYVGDNLIHDIAPAQSVGMTAVWARRAAKRKLLGTGIEPDHTIESFDELRELLATGYGVAFPKKTA